MDYLEARKVKLVCDHLNIHHISSLYKAFPAEEAHRLARRLEIYHIPRNGSWLNIAETELSMLSRQCLERRIVTIPEFKAELAAWQKERNQLASKVIWKFTTADARVKLKHPAPHNQTSCLQLGSLYLFRISNGTAIASIQMKPGQLDLRSRSGLTLLK